MTMTTIKQRVPSRSVTTGGVVGTSLGTLLEIAAALSGHPLPPGAGSAITGAIGALVAYFSPGGRRGDAR